MALALRLLLTATASTYFPSSLLNPQQTSTGEKVLRIFSRDDWVAVPGFQVGFRLRRRAGEARPEG